MIDRACGPGFQNHPRRGLCGAAICMLILLSVFPALAAQSALEPVTIQLRWFHQFQFAGYYAAIEKGFYADEGLQVSLRPFQPGQDRIVPVLKGNAQYGVGDPGLLALRDQGKPVVVLAQIFQHSPAVLISRRESGIFSADELVGKRVMLPLDDIGSASIQAMILNEIGDLNRITVVPYAYNDEKFTKGDVDAMSGYLSNEPYKLKIKGVAVNIIDPRSYSIDFYGDNLFTTEKEVVEHPERVNKVIRATLKGWAYALKHKDDIIDLILTKYNPNLNREQLRYEAKMIDQMIVPDLVPIGEINPKRYDRIAETYHRLGMITASTVPDGFIYKAEPEPVVSLTAEERAWLKAHPKIRFAFLEGFEPFMMVDAQGKQSGILVDLRDELNRRLGSNILLERISTPTEMLEMSENREIDVIYVIMPQRADKRGLLRTEVFVSTYPAIYTRQGISLKTPDDMAGKRIATLKDTAWTAQLVKPFLEKSTIIYTDNAQDGLRMLQAGEADVFVGSTTHNYLVTKYRFFGITQAYVYWDKSFSFVMGVRPDWPELATILDKGLVDIGRQGLDEIIGRWIGPSKKEEPVSLSPGERTWLKNHPNITLGYTDAFEPEIIANPDGTYSGMVVDILEKLNKKLGTDFGLRIYSIPQLLENAKAKKVGGILNILPEYADKLGLLKTRTYWPSYAAVFARKDVSFEKPDDLSGKRVAVVDKVYFTEKLLRQYGGQATILKVNTALEGFRSVQKGDADFFLGASFESYFITKYQLFGIVPAYVFLDSPNMFGIAIRPDWPQLVSILNKGIAAFSTEEIHTIIEKWSYLPKKQDTVELTPKEQAWLELNHTVRVRAADWPPYLIVKDNGPPQGIAIEYLKLIGERTGITFTYEVTDRPFAEFLEDVEQRQGPDMTALIVPTPEREQYLSFSQTYIASPYVIFTREQDELILDISGLSGKALAVMRGSTVQAQLTRDFPEIRQLAFDSDEQALQALATGQADAYIGNLSVASHIIHRRGFSGVRIAAPSPFGEQSLSMGNRNDWPELTSIIKKALASISEEEKTAISKKYVALRYEQGINKAAALRWILIVVGGAFGIIAFVIFWNRSLASQVRNRTAELNRTNQSLAAEVDQRQQAEKRVRASRDYLKSLTDSMPDAVFSVSMPDRKIEWVSDTISLLGYEAAECIGRTTEFLYPSRQDYLAFGEVMAHAVAEGKEVLRRDQDLKKKNDDTFPADITMSIFKVNGEAVSVTSIVRDISERKQRERQLQKHQKRLKALAYQLAVAEEKERRRIAADLHDNVGQALTIARMQVAATQKRVTDAHMSAELNEISSTLYEALQDTRQLMFDLSPPLLDELGLSAAIAEWLETQVGQRYNIETAFLDELDDHFEHLIEESARAILFRNVRELLINVVKHAQSNKVSVHLKNSNDRMKIIVEDDGIGFDPEAAIQSGPLNGGFGLFSIQERMADLGGSLEIASEPGKGCKATLTVPVGGKA